MSAISPALYWQVGYPPVSNTANTSRTASSVVSSPSLARLLIDLSVAAKDPALLRVHQHLDEIAKLQDNWDGHGSLHPDSPAVENAHQFLEDVYRQTVMAAAQQTQDRVAAGWESPHVSASEDGELTFEWWNANRKLTIYVGPEQATYVKSWGPHVVSEMEDGVVPNNGIPSLWEWLFA